MRLKLAVILMILNIEYINAVEPNGTISINGTREEILYHKGVKMIEPVSFCEQNLCVTKCCPYGSGYTRMGSCVNTTEIFDPLVHDKDLKLQNINVSDAFYFKIGVIVCRPMVRYLISDYAKLKDEKFYLRDDGKLIIKPSVSISPENYCIDNFIDDKNKTFVDALVCSPRDKELPSNYIITGSCMLISCVFILLTVVVYIWLPKLHNVHGRVLIAYLTCLFVGFLCMGTMQLLLHYNNAPSEFCKSITYVIYFSLLSAFFWLNVMSYDIWRVFSGTREIRAQKTQIWLQIRAYALYAFGIPTILTVLLISLEYSGLKKNPWLPSLHSHKCFLTGNSKLLYLYGPILILCVANMGLFVLTAVKIAMTKKETSVLSSRESSRHDQQKNKQTLVLYIKLFLLMGVSWILEVISALYPSDRWIYTDIYNVLIGVVIFIIFVCKRQIFQLIKERYTGVRRCPTSNTSYFRTTTTRDDSKSTQY